MKLEREYQARLIKKLRKMFPGCVILKNDPNYLQGVPDLSIFYRDKYAFLEVKIEDDSRKRPNQEYYVKTLNEMSFASFISPDSEDEVLSALQQAFGA